MAEEAAGEKSEEATPQRRREAREKGRVARSTDLNNAVVFTFSIMMLSYVGRDVLGGMSGIMRGCLQQLPAHELTRDHAIAMLTHGLWRQVSSLTPLWVGMMLAAAGIAYAQVGGVCITVAALVPKFDRINPLNGFGRLFSVSSLARLGASVMKLLAVATVAYLTIKKQLSSAAFTQPDDLLVALLAVAGLILSLATRVGVVLFVIAVFDYGYQRWDFERNLKMTKEELKEEMKRYEGDPHLKARVRQVQREMAQRRMMADAKTADVVVANPTHFAVALKYVREEMEAPKVVAKGADFVAKRIKAVAEENNVPIVENPPLARALYRTTKIGQQIPSNFYQAVAEVLAYIHRLRRQAAR